MKSRNRRRPRSSDARRVAVTLVELVVSAAAMAVLMLGMSSAILLASRALPENGAEFGGVIDASDVLAQLSSELATATAVVGRGDDEITFEVVDRDGDADPETIAYAWSGVAGDPLTRRVNKGDVHTVLENVQKFELTYTTVTVSTPSDPVQETSGEMVLASYPTASNPDTRSTTRNRWLAQAFRPTLPLNTVSWRLSRVLFYLQRDGLPLGQLSVRFRRAGNDGRPSISSFAQVTLYEASLSTGLSWCTINVPSCPDLAPSDIVCVALEHVFNEPSSKAQIQKDGVGGTDLIRLESTDGGATWSPQIRQSMVFYAYGTVTTEVQPDPVVTLHLSDVRMALQAGTADSRRVETCVSLLNRPEVSP